MIHLHSLFIPFQPQSIIEPTSLLISLIIPPLIPIVYYRANDSPSQVRVLRDRSSLLSLSREAVSLELAKRLPHPDDPAPWPCTGMKGSEKGGGFRPARGGEHLAGRTDSRRPSSSYFMCVKNVIVWVPPPPLNIQKENLRESFGLFRSEHPQCGFWCVDCAGVCVGVTTESDPGIAWNRKGLVGPRGPRGPRDLLTEHEMILPDLSDRLTYSYHVVLTTRAAYLFR